MAKRSLCADNLFLLGELLQGAVEYISRCQATFNEEQEDMMELAREQMPQLRQMVEAIDRSLDELEVRMNKKVATPTTDVVEAPPSRRRATKTRP